MLCGDKALPYYVRTMQKEDIAQVNKIDREAFPTQWPPPDYRRELQNPLARLIVVYDANKTPEEPQVKSTQKEGIPGLVSRVKQLFRRDRFFGERLPANRQYVVGFAGIWVMADEAHITNIAVRKRYQRQGIGELLLISIIDLATEQNANVITLEVRVSNIPAQSLYHKYGFAQVGVRHGYYTDNREDGLIMSTESITSAPFQSSLQQLRRDHATRYGMGNFSAKEIPAK